MSPVMVEEKITLVLGRIRGLPEGAKFLGLRDGCIVTRATKRGTQGFGSSIKAENLRY